ncbi:MAG: hypothetical protein V4773_11830 [Verrucomicrobiota bacterium]
MRDRSPKGRTSRAWGSVAPGLLAVLAVCFFFHWTVKTAGGFRPPGDEDYYNFLVQGWRSGHLYLSKAPHPAMSTLTDPYDPAQNAPYRMADASYFKGRNYLYFGAVPALLLMLPYGLATGQPLGTTSTIYVLAVVGFVAACLTFYQVRRRWFPASPPWVLPVGILVLGCCTHVLALQRRPLVWELPITSAYAFSMLTLLLVLHGLLRGWVRLWLLAGLAFGAAIASRPIYVLGAVAFVPLLWFWWAGRKDRGTSLAPAAWAVAGVGVWLLAIFAHNYARFGNPLEFGQNYQLTSIYEAKADHFAARYLPHNAYIYFASPPKLIPEFPFVAAVAVNEGPPGYLGGWNEAVCGAALSFPVLLCVLSVPWRWRRWRGEEWALLRVFLLCAACFAAAMGVTVLSYFLATPRYMADFMPALTFLAMIGLCDVAQPGTSRLVARLTGGALVLVALFSVGAGVLLSFDYHRQIAKVTAPGAWKRLDEALTPRR